MAKATAFLVLVLLVAAILNDYSVEGAGRSNQLEKDGPVYKSQKATQTQLSIRCAILRDLCLRYPEEYCPEYYRSCPPNEDLQSTTTKTDNSKSQKATPPLWMPSFSLWNNICWTCEINPPACPGDYYKMWCPPNKGLKTTATKTDNPKAKNLP